MPAMSGSPVSKTTKSILLTVSLALFLGSLGARFWASLKAAEVVGPDHIAAGPRHVYLHADEHIHVLSRAGDLVQRIPRGDVGLTDTPIDLRVLPDGRLLLAGQSPAGVRLCRTDTWTCRQAVLPDALGLQRQFKILPGTPNGDYFVSDTESGELWRVELESDSAAFRLADAGVLKKPNDLVVDEMGRLWIADSGHSRVVAVSGKTKGGFEPVMEFGTGHGLVTDGRDWPVMLAIDASGSFWVTQTDRGGGNAALLVYSPAGEASHRVELPQDAYPTDVAATGSSILVTDMDRFTVYEIDPATNAVREFGDAAFKRVMRQARQDTRRYETASRLSMFGVVLFALPMLGVAVWMTPKDRRWSAGQDELAGASSETADHPRLTDLYWLARNAKTDRFVRWIIPLYTIGAASLVVVLFGLDWYFSEILFADDPGEGAEFSELRQVSVLMVILLLGMWPLVKMGHISMRKRLGTEGTYLYARHPDGLVETLVPENLVYSSRHIVDGTRVIAVRTGNGRPLYEAGELEKYVLPLLVDAKRLNSLQMSLHMLKGREPSTIYGLVFFAGFALYLYFSGLWRVLLA